MDISEHPHPQDAPTPDAPTPDAPTPDAPTPDAPAQDAPAQDAPAQDAPAQDAAHTDGVLPSDDLRDVPAATLQLVRAIGARLRAPLAARRRDELAVELAAVAAAVGASTGTASGGSAGDRIGSDGPLPSRPSSSRPASSRPAASARSVQRWSAAAVALVVFAGGVGVLSRTADDLPVIALAAGPGAGPATAMDAAGAREGALSEPAMGDMMWWVPTEYRFVLADGVSFPAGQALAWRLAPPADLAAAAAPIAATLGLPDLGPSEWDTSALWSESSAVGSLWIAPSGDWYYSGPSDQWPVWDCAAVDMREDRTGPAPLEECSPPAPPVGVPDADRARVLAAEFLATVGHSEVRILDVWADEWGAWVTAEPSVAGVPSGSGLTVSVGFGGQGRVTSANGTLASVERIGEYPTIDAVAAVARLEGDLNSWQQGGPVARPMPADVGGLLDGGPVEGDPGSADRDTPGVDGPDVPVDSGDTPVTILPVPDGDTRLPGPDGDVEPVVLTVTIVSLELVTTLAWTASGEMLLLPHYRLVDSEGGWWFVVAVADRYLAR